MATAGRTCTRRTICWSPNCCTTRRRRAAQAIWNVPYAQEAQLFLGDGRGKFRDASRTAGPDFTAPRVGRGVARCDFDNDGRPDLCLSAVGGPVALLRNATETANHWIG